MEQSTTHTDSPLPAAEPDLITQKIVHAVADELRVDPVDLDPLYDVVDPDALNSLFHSRPRVNSLGTGAVRFTYQGFEVHVTAGGDVSLEARTVQNAD
ncbi:HalOD1 output domain-containing protein [Halobacterium wangiae]|uniref:HalOD1 output domain-containing protein n=1 Tax=Halobacterium wangiae TaxID=2902623 RepID=UPI001E434088|nr:HalOD1 output domain-containing protein [Halobacterium wangiae]